MGLDSWSFSAITKSWYNPSFCLWSLAGRQIGSLKPNASEKVFCNKIDKTSCNTPAPSARRAASGPGDPPVGRGDLHKNGLVGALFLGDLLPRGLLLELHLLHGSTSKAGLSVGKESKVGPEQGQKSSGKVPWCLSPGRSRDSHRSSAPEASWGSVGCWRSCDLLCLAPLRHNRGSGDTSHARNMVFRGSLNVCFFHKTKLMFTQCSSVWYHLLNFLSAKRWLLSF